VLKWRWLAFTGGIFPALLVLLMFFMPETPVWSLSHHKRQDAIKALKWLKGPNIDTEDECYAIESTLGTEKWYFNIMIPVFDDLKSLHHVTSPFFFLLLFFYYYLRIPLSSKFPSFVYMYVQNLYDNACQVFFQRDYLKSLLLTRAKHVLLIQLMCVFLVERHSPILWIMFCKYAHAHSY